jgi:hypothetical protein
MKRCTSITILKVSWLISTLCRPLIVVRDHLLQQDGRSGWCRTCKPCKCLIFAHDKDLWGQNALDHHTFDQNLEAAMLYVRYCRQNLKPTPAPSPVAEPSQELITVYNKYPNLDASAHFNPKLFRDHLDGAFEQFGRHMVEEIKTLSKENVEKIGEKNLDRIDVGLKKELMAHEPEWFLCSNCCE